MTCLYCVLVFGFFFLSLSQQHQRAGFSSLNPCNDQSSTVACDGVGTLMWLFYQAIQAPNPVLSQLSSSFLSYTLGAEVRPRDQSVSAPSEDAGALGHCRGSPHASRKVRMRVCLPAPPLNLPRRSHGPNCGNSLHLVSVTRHTYQRCRRRRRHLFPCRHPAARV